MLNRQEIAFIYFDIAVLALIGARLARRRRTTTFIIAAAGSAVSHYTSAYTTAALLIPAWLLRRLRPPRWLRPVRACRVSSPVPAVAHAVVPARAALPEFATRQAFLAPNSPSPSSGPGTSCGRLCQRTVGSLPNCRGVRRGRIPGKPQVSPARWLFTACRWPPENNVWPRADWPFRHGTPNTARPDPAPVDPLRPGEYRTGGPRRPVGRVTRSVERWRCGPVVGASTGTPLVGLQGSDPDSCPSEANVGIAGCDDQVSLAENVND